MLHLVEGEGVLCPRDAISAYLHDRCASVAAEAATAEPVATLKSVGTRYRVVGVFGGQSTGKSTLLNNLFGTSFDVMDSSGMRQQTTKGAFFAKSVKESTQVGPLFVVDFEGTDGQERGEDQHFERQLSLFALSVADVLIVNMMASEVGRLNAANLPLLRTVFEVNLQLFAVDPTAVGKDGKPTLLFVIRDNTAPTEDRLFETIMKSLTGVWDKVVKPPAMASWNISDVFDLRFTTLPHYELQREAFDGKVAALRSWFVDPSSAQDKFLFHGPGTFRGIPLEGLPQYLSSCWESIVTHKDLDIPTQRDMLARLRCSDVYDGILVKVAEEVKNLKSFLEAGELAPNLSQILETKKDRLLAEFDEETKLYAPSIVEKCRLTLESTLQHDYDEVVEAQCRKLAQTVMKGAEVGETRTLDQLRNTLVVQLAHDYQERLSNSAGKSASRTVDIRPFVRKAWLFISAEVDQTVSEIRRRVAEPPVNGGGGGTAATDVDATIRLIASVLHGDGPSTTRTLAIIESLARENIIRRLRNQLSDPAAAMIRVFERALNYQPDGTVRIFGTVRSLQSAIEPARAAGLLFLAICFADRLEASGEEQLALESFFLDFDLGDAASTSLASSKPIFPTLAAPVAAAAEVNGGTEVTEEANGGGINGGAAAAVSAGFSRKAVSAVQGRVILDASSVLRAHELFLQHVDFTYKMMVKQIESGQQNIPSYMWALLIFFGANEMYAVITNPFLLILVITLIYVFLRQWVVAQWEKFEQTGPPAVVMTLQAVFHVVGGAYQQHVQPALAKAGLAAPHVEPAKAGTEGKKTK